MKISSVACVFCFIRIDYSDYPKSLISRINEVYIFFQKLKLYLSRLFCCNHTCYCVNMVSVTSASRYITSASRYHPRYQSRSLMYIRGLIPQNFAELAEAAPIDSLNYQRNSLIRYPFGACKVNYGSLLNGS